jgi:hypothetical protein
MSLIQDRIKEFLDQNNMKILRQETWIWCKAIYSIKNWHRNKKYTKQTLDTLYDFFNLTKDTFYIDNMKKWLKSDESILWVLLKNRRDKLWFSKKEVAKIIKWTEREMTRIEAWDVAPKFNSYYLRELIKLYKFSESEWNQIKWYVASLHDIIELNRNT